MNDQDEDDKTSSENRDDASSRQEADIIRFEPRKPGQPQPPSEDPSMRRRPEPFFNLPALTQKLIFLLIIHLFIGLFLSPGEVLQLFRGYGFVPGRYTGAIPFEWQAVIAPFTHMILHGGWMHLGMNMLMLAAFGSGTERILGTRAMLKVLVASGLGGAVFHLIVFPAASMPMIGASGAISGLFGAVIVLLNKAQRLAGAPMGANIVWPLATLWIGITLIFGIFVPGPGGQDVAWTAHIGGFLTGLFMVYRGRL